MSTQTTIAAPVRKGRHLAPDYIQTASPTPGRHRVHRALTTVAGKSRLTITLAQPCVIRSPNWPLIDCTANTLVPPTSVTVVSNTQFYMDYGGLLASMVAFVQVPYQTCRCRTSRGLRAERGQWFREPVSF